MNEKTESGSSFVQDLRDAAGRNPVSAALIGMGVLWMLTGAKAPAAAQSVVQSAGLDRIPEALENVRSGLKESAGSVKGAAASTLDAVREHGASTFDSVADYGRKMPEPGAVFDTARDGLAELFRAQPLALGAIGLAIGAGIAAALPKTRPLEAAIADRLRWSCADAGREDEGNTSAPAPAATTSRRLHFALAFMPVSVWSPRLRFSRAHAARKWLDQQGGDSQRG